MKLIEVQTKLLSLRAPVLQTSDASALLKVTRAHASKLLSRLAKAGIMIPVARGVWAFAEKLDPLILPEYLTAPLPSYISLQTALYYHGMISQIPEVIYAISLARTRKYKTPKGVISIHHIQPELFFGFEVVGNADIKMATPEKALLDVLYLTPAKSQLFRSLPELEIPSNFEVRAIEKMILKIPHLRLRTVVKNRLAKLL